MSKAVSEEVESSTKANSKPKVNVPVATKAAAKPQPAKKSTSKPDVKKTAEKKVVVKKATATKPTVVKAASLKPQAKKPVAVKPTSKPAASMKTGQKVPSKKTDDKVKSQKVKLERDSFTMPKDEYAQLANLKARLSALGQPAKKSELLRAGIKLLVAMSDNTLKMTMAKVPVIKTGRPKK